MSVANKLLQAAAGNAGADPVYVDDVFSTFLYEGTGADDHIITNGIDLLGKGGLVWIKNRDQTDDHILVDTERGRRYTLSTNSTATQVYDSDTVATFYSDGFRMRQDEKVNTSGEDYVSWTFRKQAKFFDVVTYTGNGTAGRTVSHSLGSVPGMIIVKSTSAYAGGWQVYHRKADATAPEDKYLQLNSTSGASDSSSRWNDTAPTATEFTVGSGNEVNGNSTNYVAYLFAHDEQEFGENSDEAIIKCDSFTTDSSGNGSVDLGFEPQLILIKKTNSTGAWGIMDSMRGFTFNGTNKFLFLHATNAETDNTLWDIRNNGFNLNSGGANNTFMYVAIRRPNKPASEFAATNLFSVKKDQPASGGVWEHTHLTDMSFYKWQNGSQNWGVQDRLRGAPDLSFNSSAAENALIGGNAWDVMTGYLNSNPAAGAYTSWAFRRAKGFFDVVAYTGTGANRTVSHNLGVTPELMIKDRGLSNHWAIYNSESGATKYLHFTTAAPATSSTYFNDTEPTSSVFTVGTQSRTNRNNGNFVAYLFASVDGISKVGTYTGDGTTDGSKVIDCGMPSGPRLVILKKLDSTGHWFVYDTERGIATNGVDYQQLFTNNTASTTNYDKIDIVTNGFSVKDNSGSNNGKTNHNGKDYIFLAIA